MQQAIGRVCLVVLACELSRHAETVTRLSEALDISDWDGPADLPSFGIRNAVSHAAGLEVVAPLTEDSPVRAHLRERGEGVFGIVFGVRNLQEALRRAQANGLGPADLGTAIPAATVIDSLVANDGGPVFPSYPKRFAVHQEVVLQPIAGVTFLLGQLEPLMRQPTTAPEGTS